MRKLILFVAISLFIPQSAFAVGAMVTGCANGGPFATPMGVSSAATSAATTVTASVERVGQSLKMSQKKVVASINKNFEAQNAILRQVLTSLGISRQKMNNMRMFGPQSKAYGIGLVENRLQKVMKGMSAKSDLSGKFRDELSEFSRVSSTKGQRNFFYSLEDVSATSPFHFFPSNSTLSSGQLKNLKYAYKAIADPYPTPKLPEDFKNTRAGKKYTSKRKIKYSYLAQPTAVVSDIASTYAPTIELGGWAEKVYKRMGGYGKPPEVVNGKVSLMGYINMMVDSRFANQNWYSGKQGIHSKTPTGLLRELLVMESVKMKMQNQQMRRMQQMSGLLAQEQAIKTGEQMNDPLEKLYRKVVQ